MSVFVYGRSMLAAAALSALGSGCGPDALPQGSLRSGFSVSSPGWNLVGVNFGTIRHDEATDLWIHPENGSVYVSGYENGTLGMTSVDPSGDTRGVIHKFSADLSSQGTAIKFGNGNGKSEVIEAVVGARSSSTSPWELYFAGRTTGSFNNTPNAGQYDTIAGWTSLTGTQKVFQFGTNRPQHPRRLALDNAGGMIISGYDDIYIPSNYVEAWEDPFVMKLQRSGTNLTVASGWPLQFNTGITDLLPGMAMKPDANAPIYIAGANASGSTRGMFVKKLQQNGTVEWVSQQSPVSVDMGAALHVLPDNNVLFTGSTYFDFGQPVIGEQDIVVRKLTPNQGEEPVWTRLYGTTSSDWVTDMTVDADGNIYLVGQTLGSFHPNIPPPEDNSDIFLIKLNSNGTAPEYFQLSSPGEDYPSSVAVGPQGDIYVAGYTTDLLFDGTMHNGQRDGFVFRVTPPGMGTGAY
ncbi:SBBP repeat-containing protein [Hyalangium rubrum]|uniref:SBBP repeat-containing protein n=1 Tax=Hyalangium rubrum TaxID=3103134 RepID=A0ABU5HAP6_9BACT|nr:SBBP repeat-containing protein [Hyalangium sp. s54d21]MDY7230326.1 SBBP repeat-containing protein [Hyalangium sp. s54d21]